MGLMATYFTTFLQDCFQSVPGLLWSTPRMGMAMNLDFCFPQDIFAMDLINKYFGIPLNICVCDRYMYVCV